MTIPLIALNDGSHIPQLGLGTFKMDPADTARVVGEAIEIGYRHLDAAAIYGNEAEVGAAIRASGLARADFYLTTKVWNNDHVAGTVPEALHRSLDLLGVESVDLYLIHWPLPPAGKFGQAWKQLIQLRDDGLTRSIGVANFMPEHLEQLWQETGIKPAVNQIELHPTFQQREVVDYCFEHGIEVESWGPLGQGKYPLLEEAEIVAAATAHGKTPAQVVLRWHLQQRFIVFPKSARMERLRENIEVFDFELSASEMEAITALERGNRVGPDPRSYERYV